WFSAGLEPEASSEPATRSADLVCWQATLSPLLLVHVPQQMWLLACSLTFLAVGLGVYFLALPRLLAWAVYGLVAWGILLAVILWPSTLPIIIYGCEPGFVVMLLVLGFLWVRQRSYQRQVVFMPGFSRLSPGSSVIRTTGSSHRARIEPSTVD